MSELVPEREKYRDEEGNVIKFEKCYIPFEDPSLMKKGIEVCARTEVDLKSGRTKNSVIFLKDDVKLSEMPCIHTAFCQAELREYSSEEREAIEEGKVEQFIRPISTEEFPNIQRLIDPEQHFISLKAFLGHIVETGIEKSLMDSLQHRSDLKQGKVKETYTLIDDQTQHQLLKSLVEVAPNESKTFALFAIDYLSADIPERYNLFSEEFKEIICKEFDNKDLMKLQQINEGVLHLPIGIQSCIVNKGSLPEFLVREFSKSDDVTLLVDLIHHNEIPEETLKQLVEKDKRIKSAVLRNVREVPLSILEDFATSPDLDTRTELAENPKLPRTILNILSNDISPEVRRELAKHINISPENEKYISQLSEDPLPMVRVALASRGMDLPKPILLSMVKDEKEDVRYAIATSSVTYREALNELATDEEYSIRSAVASRFDLLPETQKILARDSDKRIREEVAENPAISSKALHILTLDIDPKVRYLVASHYETSPNDLKILAHDSQDLVRKEVASREELDPDILTILVKDLDPTIRKEIASDINLPKDVLKELAIDPEESVRVEAVWNESLEPKDLELFLADKSKLVREAIILQRNLTDLTIKTLIQDPDKDVRSTLLMNIQLGEDDMKALAYDPSSSVRERIPMHQRLIPDSVQKILVGDEAQLVRILLAMSESLNSESAKLLVRDNVTDVRREVALNPQTDEDILRMLEEDKSSEVRTIARYRLGEIPSSEVSQKLLETIKIRMIS